MVTTVKIKIIANNIVDNVKKKYELPTRKDYNMRTCAWILASYIENPKQEIHAKKVGSAKKYDGEYTKKIIGQKNYIKLAKKFITYVKENGKLPPHLAYGDLKIQTKVYTHAFACIVKYHFEHGKFPDNQEFYRSAFTKPKPIPTCKSPYVSSPHFLDEGAGYLGQITPYTCGPHSCRQALKKLDVVVSESTLASWAGTTYDGTDHDGIETAIAKAAKEAGVNIDVEWVNFNELGWKGLGELLCQKNVAAFLHISYSGAGEYYDSEDSCGHYEPLDKIDTDDEEVRALNSLGSREGYGYYGHLQWRSFWLQQKYISGISQKSVCILRKK